MAMVDLRPLGFSQDDLAMLHRHQDTMRIMGSAHNHHRSMDSIVLGTSIRADGRARVRTKGI